MINTPTRLNLFAPLQEKFTMRTKKPMKLMLAALGTSAMMGIQANAALTAAWDFEGDLVEGVSNTTGTALGSASATGTAIADVGSNSLSLTGGADGVDSGTTGGLGGTGSFTVIATIQTSTEANATIFNFSPSGGGTAGGSLRLIVQANGDFRVEMNSGAGFNLTAGDLGDGETHKVGVVFDSTAGDSFQDLDLYVDGTLYDVTGGTDHAVDLVATGAGPLVVFGQDQVSSGNRPFVGLIDDVMIFDQALSATQITNAAVPEPGSLALLGLGGLCLLRRRRI